MNNLCSGEIRTHTKLLRQKQNTAISAYQTKTADKNRATHVKKKVGELKKLQFIFPSLKAFLSPF